MAEAFTHLHVSGAFSGHPGGASPEDLVAGAVADGASALACTDRDGLYGAVKHLRECERAGIDALVGVDLTILAEPIELGGVHETEEDHGEGRNGDAHDGDARDGDECSRTRHIPRGSAGVAGRVVVLAHGNNDGAGWEALCRLVSDAHAHTNGRTNGPIHVGVLRSEIAARCVDPDTGKPLLTVLLGPDSDVGLALSGDRFLRPRTLFREWLAAMPVGVLAVELVTHLSGAGQPFSTGHAVRMLRLASEHGIPAVLTNAVRGLRESDDRDAWLKPAEAMHAHGGEIIHAARLGRQDLANLLGNTERIADRCRLDLARDVGWRKPMSPEPSVLGWAGEPNVVLAERCRMGIGHRFPALADEDETRILRRLDAELELINVRGLASYFLAVAEVTEAIRGMGVRSAPRGPAASSLVNYLLGISNIDPLRHGVGFEPFLSREGPRLLPDIGLDVESAQRHSVFRKIAERFGAERVMLMGAAHGSHDDGAARDDRLDLEPEQCPALAMPPGSPSGATAHPCGVILGDAGLRTRIPRRSTSTGMPLSQFDREDLDLLGVLRLDVVGIPLQSAIASAVREIARIGGAELDLDAISFDDESALECLSSPHPFEVDAFLRSETEGFGYDAAAVASMRRRLATTGLRSIEARGTALAILTYQSAWLEAHHPEAFLAGLLEHAPPTHPQRLLIAEARRRAVPILPVDINASRDEYRVERIESGADAGRLGIRSAFKSAIRLSEGERRRIAAGQPYASITDLRDRAQLARPSLRRLGELGAFDTLHRAARGGESRADLVAHLAGLAAATPGRGHELIRGQLALDLGDVSGTTSVGANR